MKNVSGIVDNKGYDLKREFRENLKDETFKSLVEKLKIHENVGCLYSTSLMDSVIELKNCKQCTSLMQCRNKLIGHYLYPKVEGKIIDLVYVPCKFKRENDKLLRERMTADKEYQLARFKEIDMTDKKRINVIKWLKDFFDNYDGIKEQKGLYLHGSFGSGKTYLIYALLNELKMKKNVQYEAVYFPKMLQDLKEDWDSYGEKMEYYQSVPILFLDDIGAESVSEWARDEVLGTILQSRMNNHLTTFFTSNLTYQELEYNLSLAKNSLDKVKGRRIMERIKQLTVDMEMVAENKRK